MRKFLSRLALVAGLLAATSSAALAQTSDAISPSSVPNNVSLGYVYNGATWDRLRGSTGGLTLNNFPTAAALGDAVATPTTTNIGSENYLFNGTTWDRQRSAAGTTGIPVVNTESTKATYDTSVFAVGAGATINDVCSLPGSASKTIRMLTAELSMAATAASDLTLLLSKRSAAPTGTAGTAMTAVPRDSAFAAASSAPLRWADSSAQVPGAAIGNIATPLATVVTAASAVPSIVRYNFAASDNGSAVILRGVAQAVAWNLANVATPTGFQFNCRFTWTEE